MTVVFRKVQTVGLLKFGHVVALTSHMCSIVEIDFARYPFYYLSFCIILNVDEVMIHFANQGILFTLYIGDGTFVERRSRVLSSRVGIFTTCVTTCVR